MKGPELIGAGQLAEERAYVESNPHAAELGEVCRRARIAFGRVDYALLGGRIQVWEINTNPLFAFPGAADPPGRDGVHRRAAAQLVEALLELG